eukprot:gene15345-21431_t
MHNYCKPEYLQWKYRREHIFEELAKYDSDIVCLQEVEQCVFKSELTPWMAEKGFKGWYYARQRTVRFSECPLPVDPPPKSGAPSKPSSTSFWDTFQKREEGAIMALLEHTPSGRPMLAACTHLFWNPRFPDVKALQASVLCQEIRRFLNETHYAKKEAAATSSRSDNESIDIPLIVGGDFNSLWRKYKSDVFDRHIPSGGSLQSGVYTLMGEGTLPPTHHEHPFTRRAFKDSGSIASSSSDEDIDLESLPRCSVSEDFRGVDLTSSGLELRSTHMLAHGWEPPLTTKTATFAGCLDYIWVNPGSGLKTEHTLSLPYEFGSSGVAPDGERSRKKNKRGQNSSSGPRVVEDPLTQLEFSSIPDEYFPSDHIAVGLPFGPWAILHWSASHLSETQLELPPIRDKELPLGLRYWAASHLGKAQLELLSIPNKFFILAIMLWPVSYLVKTQLELPSTRNKEFPLGHLAAGYWAVSHLGKAQLELLSIPNKSFLWAVLLWHVSCLGEAQLECPPIPNKESPLDHIAAGYWAVSYLVKAQLELLSIPNTIFIRAMLRQTTGLSAILVIHS